MKAVSGLLLLLISSCFAAELGLIIIPAEVKISDRFLSNYDVRGSYPEFSVVVGDLSTLSSLQESFPESYLAAPFDSQKTYLVVERPEFDFSTLQDEANWAFKTQQAISFSQFEVVVSSRGRYIISSSAPLSEKQFSLFPSETEFVTLPTSKILPVPGKNRKLLAKLKENFVKRDDVSDLVGQVTGDSLTNFDLYLTGERNDSTLNSRNSFSPEVTAAANWIAARYRESGFSAELQSFTSTYGPNVIAILPGSIQPNKYVVVGAHYDSRATDRSSGTQRAPGANDDGSGTAILLEIAKLIAQNNVKFRYSIILGSWCGEEQGLVGSRAYAEKSKDEGLDIIAMLQGDMLAYRKPGEAAQCAFPDRYHTPELTELAKEVVTTYVPDVEVCVTSACCSDHQSFYELGYSATQFFERCGSIADNQYHREGDLVDRTGFNVEQWVYNAQAIFASLLTLAEIV